MITITLLNNRVDIEMLLGWRYLAGYNFHCYKFGHNYLYRYRFTKNWKVALLFLFNYYG